MAADALATTDARSGDRTTLERLVGALTAPGWIAKGVLFVAVGLIAVNVVVNGGEPDGQQGALRAIARQPLGPALLWTLAAGLVVHGVWRGLTAFLPSATDASALLGRVAYGVSGIVYLALGFSAADIANGPSGGGRGEETERAQQGTAFLLELPAGPLVVIAVGIGFGVIGAVFVWWGLASRHLERVDTAQVPARRLFEQVGLVGHVARGAVFGVIGWFLVDAALGYDPEKAVGLDGALSRLAAQSFGPWILGALAFGFLAYGVWAAWSAPYQEVEEPA